MSEFFRFFNKSKDEIFQTSSISSLSSKILTGKEDLKKVQPYLDKLKDTLNAKDINNIALTGGYGSGKSTILKTFQYWNKKEYNFLNISLAAFNQTKVKENFKELYDLKIKNGKTEKEAEIEITNEFKETIINNEELERQLEISILQQIVYKVKPSNLPASRFKRIYNTSSKKLFFIGFLFVLWFISTLLVYKLNYFEKILPNNWNSDDNINWLYITTIIISLFGIGYFSKLFVELFSNSKINKVNLKGEIEIGDNSSKSILNEHYDEILYFFEKNPLNVVVIEDLDRFQNTNIFTKLRELNILLNNSDILKNKKEYKIFGIKFLYAVGDDLFDDKKERVKFFEYIIPVIPFINSSNAEEQLQTLIKESELEDNIFHKEFLSDITTFIDDIDMRLLINIFHEFVIYRKVLNPDMIKGNEAELFAMITYKNIDPEDYNKLNSKKGKLYKLLSNKSIYIKDLIKENDSKISNIEEEIKNIKEENITSIKELRSIYINQITTKFPDIPIYFKEIEINKLTENDEFEKLIEDESLSYRYRYQNHYNSSNDILNFNFSKIENEVNPNFTYKEREEFVNNKQNNRIEIQQKEIAKLEKQKSEIKNWDLKQIFREVGINQYLKYFSNNELLRNLILEGYINEKYNDYISLFHEVSLTKEDKKFERSVKSGINEDFGYHLTNIENLVDKHIGLKYFERNGILNFSLLDFLGNNYNKYSKQYDSIINLLSNETNRSLEFIERYIKDEKRPLEVFIQKLVENWKGLWGFIYNRGYSDDKLDIYLYLMIRYVEIDTIIENQNNDYLSQYIEIRYPSDKVRLILFIIPW